MAERLMVIMPNGRQFGPVDRATVRQWLQAGQVPDEAIVRDETTSREWPAASFRESPGENPFASPAGIAPPPADEAVSVVIPYRNPPALTAYYLGLFSLSACIPLLGIVGVAMAIAAVVLGRRGLRLAASNPQAHGRVHAWIGIIGGSVFAVFGILMQVVGIIGVIGAILDKK
jgi:hypothetical protein